MRIHGSAFELSIAAIAEVGAGGWSRVRVEFAAPGVEGGFTTEVEPSNFASFGVELAALAESLEVGRTARLATTEGDVTVELTMQPRGAIHGTYVLRTGPTTDGYVEVRGSFELDQSYLSEIRRSNADTIAEMDTGPSF